MAPDSLMRFALAAYRSSHPVAEPLDDSEPDSTVSRDKPERETGFGTFLLSDKNDETVWPHNALATLGNLLIG